jgi:hypothetical protein
MSALDPEDWPDVNNGGGTLVDPVHEYTWEKGDHAGATLSVRQSDLTAHFLEVLTLAKEGKAVHPKTDPADMATARDWYRNAHQTCLTIRDDFNRQYPDAHLTLEQVAGVMAAVSPRKAWDVTHPKTGNKSGNVEDCRRIIAAHLSGRLDGMSVEEASKHTKGGMHTHVAIGIRILRGEDPSVMSGLKRKSFWNCIVNPETEYDTTIDGWMASAVWRMGATYSDGKPVDEDALDWIDHKKTRDGQTVIEGAGYILVADALREAADALGLTPTEAQAMYWVSVGGGRKDTQMWSWARKERNTSKKARAKARRAATTAGGTAMIPELDEDGGEWTAPDDFDAVAISEMADCFTADTSPGLFNSTESAFANILHPTAGQIQYCWENPNAWEILGADVDRQWFMEQVATRTADL